MQSRPTRSSWLLTLGTLVLITAHVAVCWRMIDGWQGVQTPYPIVRDDHTFNYYYAVTTQSYLKQSASTAGYDPYFMSGYAKSILYPTSSTLPELVVYFLGGEHPERAFKLYVVGVAMLCPVLVWLAAWLWTGRHTSAQLTLILYLAYFWSDKGAWYVVVGMVPYPLAGALAALSTAALSRFLTNREQPQDALGAFASWTLLTVSAAVAVLVHLTVPIAAGPAWLALLVSRWRTCSLARKLSLCVSILLVLAMNLFWLVPGFLLWETKGRTDVVFVEPEVLGRLQEVALAKSPIEITLLLLSLFGLAIWRRADRASFRAALATIIWCFFLAYPSGWIRALDFLQPGRYALYLFTFATVPAGIALDHMALQVRSRLSHAFDRAIVVTGWSVAVGLALYVSWGNLKPVVLAQPPVLSAELPRHFEELILTLRQWTKPGERLLFEDRNRGIVRNGVPVLDPFLSIRPAPLIPLLTGLECIGGPYLYNHHKTNFTQVGDGRFFGEEVWDVSRFRRFARDYDLSWIVCWSPEARAFCAQHPELVEIKASIGPQAFPLWLGKIRREPYPALIGSAKVTASPGRIEVREARPKDGVLVLRYHWTPSLVSSPPLQIDEFPIEEDPVGMIRIHNPPADFTITLDPWEKLRSWFSGK